MSGEHDLAPVEITPEALTVLMDHDWPGNIRELRNLIESIVVMMPGRTITPADLPPSIRGGSANLPVPVMPPPRGDGDGEGTRSALEFIFRMMMQLRMEVEDLKRGFDEFRAREAPASQAIPLAYPIIHPAPGRELTAHLRDHDARGLAADAVHDNDRDDLDDQDDDLDAETTVVYRPGMTMKDLEREAIIAALKGVGGNRREAADQLGIGERTLYRKIKEYGIPL
jgi:DNA-binding NtrC family response regulator